MTRKTNKTTLSNAVTPTSAPANTMDTFLVQQQGHERLRLIACGNASDGKSTLIARLLWESHQLFDDQLAPLKNHSKKSGGQDNDFAAFADGLAAEREQGSTHDVAYRFFSTKHRTFIAADIPDDGALNLMSAASTADVAILLVDARHGIRPQTRRHAYLVSLMGIRHVVLAINKMDLTGHDAASFAAAQNTFLQFAHPLGFETISVIPISALKGDNIVRRSSSTPWYQGPSLMNHLELIGFARPVSPRLVYPIQWVNHPDVSFRGYAGTVAEGSVKVGDEIRVTTSGKTAKVTGIVTMDGKLPEASQGQAITLTFDRNIEAARGDVLSLANNPLETSNQFEASIVWMSAEEGLIGRDYQLKLATQWVSASLTSIKHRINVNTLTHEAAKKFDLNDICVCNIATSKPIVFDSYANSKTLGGFILVDRHTNATVAAGMITHSLRRAQNVHRQALSITRADRESLNGHQGKVIWFTGLSGSGKSTIANALEVALHAQGRRTYILDGDNVRQGLNKDLGFTDADRVENIRRIAEVAKLMMDAGLMVMTSFISPFRREREMARELIGTENFIEVYVNTPLEVCEQRDPKGLYKKARSGQLPNLTGIGSPYEAPESAEVLLDNTLSIQGAIQELMHAINRQK